MYDSKRSNRMAIFAAVFAFVVWPLGLLAQWRVLLWLSDLSIYPWPGREQYLYKAAIPSVVLAAGAIAVGIGMLVWIRQRRADVRVSPAVLVAVSMGLFDVCMALAGVVLQVYQYVTWTAPNIVIGRPTEGPLPDLGASGFWEDMASAEFSSVGAFARLANELSHLGAPEELVDGCLRAANEEWEHARFAIAHCDAELPQWNPPKRPVPTPWSLGWESLWQGAVVEGLATLAARSKAGPHQIEARTWRRLADEEMGHARLSFSVAVWGLTSRPGRPRECEPAVSLLSEMLCSPGSFDSVGNPSSMEVACN